MDRIDLADVELFGSGLKRPEGVMVARDGVVWAAHGDGACTRITPDGRGENVGELGGTPNGICIDRDGSIVIANIGGSSVQRLFSDGRHETITDTMNGRKFSSPNFPFIDSKDRLWVTNSTAREDMRDALRNPGPDGCLCVIADGKTRIVAEGLLFANGVAVDRDERYVYVAETTAFRMMRFEINDDGSVGPGEQYGPELGKNGHPDGAAFDSEGNLWVTLPARNAIGVIDPAGEWHIVVDDPDGVKLKRPTNICFGGDDLRTAYIGSLDGTSLPRFQVPYPGMPLIHQTTQP